jgi:hypothetical protein
MTSVDNDFEELLKLFNKHKVKYCVVGAFAVAFHAIARYTKDLDLIVAACEVNGERIITALNEFDFGSLKLTPGDFSKKGDYIQ